MGSPFSKKVLCFFPNPFLYVCYYFFIYMRLEYMSARMRFCPFPLLIGVAGPSIPDLFRSLKKDAQMCCIESFVAD